MLGRGGSDTAAAYLASRIGAARVEIWTDVPGLFTANPRAVSGARLIHRLGYAEAETLATMGAAALHPRAIGPVREAGIPMHIAWTRHPELEGTVIGSQIGEAGVKAISSRNGLCLVSTRRPASWQPVGFMADVAECFRKHELCMDLVSSSPSDIRATVDLDADPSAEGRMRSAAPGPEPGLRGQPDRRGRLGEPGRPRDPERPPRRSATPCATWRDTPSTSWPRAPTTTA